MSKRKLCWPPLGIHPLSAIKVAYIRHVVDTVDGNISEAARLLKVQRFTVRNALSGLGKHP